MSRTLRLLLQGLVGVLLAAGLGALIGYAFSIPTPTPSVVPVEEEEPFVVPELDQPAAAPGVRGWGDLRGGECLESFDSPWQENFVVVPCAMEHEAEFVRASIPDSLASSPYPGDDAMREYAGALCTQWDRGDLRTGDQYADLLVVPGYTLGEEAWKTGNRLVGCFVYREGGDALGSKLTN